MVSYISFDGISYDGNVTAWIIHVEKIIMIMP